MLVLHALTGDSHVVGPAGPGHPTPGWWDGLIGPGAPIDTDRWCAVATNVLGGCQGTTGPTSPARDGRPWGSRFPLITVRDQVAAEVALADALGIDRWAAVVGGSMGGMRALEWMVGHPDRVRAGAGAGGRRAGDRRPDRHAEPPRCSRSSPTRTGRAATTTAPPRARARTPGWSSPAGSRT